MILLHHSRSDHGPNGAKIGSDFIALISEYRNGVGVSSHSVTF